MSEGRVQHVSADSLELLAVTAVDDGRGVKVHAEGGLGPRRPSRRLGRRQVRAGEPELHADGQRRVEVQVVVLGDGGGGLVDLRERLADKIRPRSSLVLALAPEDVRRRTGTDP